MMTISFETLLGPLKGGEGHSSVCRGFYALQKHTGGTKYYALCDYIEVEPGDG